MFTKYYTYLIHLKESIVHESIRKKDLDDEINHIENVIKKGEHKFYSCEECGNKFATKQNLNTHKIISCKYKHKESQNPTIESKKIRAFGQEVFNNIEVIKVIYCKVYELIEELLKNNEETDAITKLICWKFLWTHYNNDFPENCNIIISNYRTSAPFQIYNGITWIRSGNLNLLLNEYYRLCNIVLNDLNQILRQEIYLICHEKISNWMKIVDKDNIIKTLHKLGYENYNDNKISIN
jgi:hypothetical protein